MLYTNSVLLVGIDPETFSANEYVNNYDNNYNTTNISFNTLFLYCKRFVLLSSKIEEIKNEGH
jgi:hypothetical protein